MNYTGHTSYDIIFLGEDDYQFLASGEVQLRGTLAQLFYFMTRKFGFDFEEVSTAVLELSANDHRKACFGIYKKFMYTIGDEDMVA